MSLEEAEVALAPLLDAVPPEAEAEAVPTPEEIAQMAAATAPAPAPAPADVPDASLPTATEIAAMAAATAEPAVGPEVPAPLVLPEEAPAKPARTTPEEPDITEIDPLALGNVISITSDEYGYTSGRVIYRDNTLVRLMPLEVSDRAVDFPLVNDGAEFSPDLGVTDVMVEEPTPVTHFVDLIGVRPGDTLEFFGVDGTVIRPPAEVAEVIKTRGKDTVILTDGTPIKFRRIGPPAPIAVVRVRTAINAPAVAVEGAPADAATDADAAERQTALMSLLSQLRPTETAALPIGDTSFPDSMQREDLFQDLLAKIPTKQRSNPRRIRFVDREVDLAMALKGAAVVRNAAGRITGPAPNTINTAAEAIVAGQGSILPMFVPIVDAARVLNLDELDPTQGFKRTDVTPRVLSNVLQESETAAQMYLSTAGGKFPTYMYNLMERDAITLTGPTPMDWPEDQDVVRTAGLGTPVQALSIDPETYKEDTVISLAQLNSDTTDRYMRVLRPDTVTLSAFGRTEIIAPSDPSSVKGYVVLPVKAALQLRPPTRPGDMPMALLYSAALEADNLPTVARTLRDLYAAPEVATPLNAVTVTSEIAANTSLAAWLNRVLKYAVHPIDSLGPRGPYLLSVLDAMGLGNGDLSPEVTEIIDRWVRGSQKQWRDLLKAERERIKAILDTEETRTFQSVTGEDSPTWQVLRDADELKELLGDVQRRNPTIFGTPTTVTAALMSEAQGDATPLVWFALARFDGRESGIDAPTAAAALAASRAYLLRRRVLRDFGILNLRGEPEINTCPHVNRLEAIHNVDDALQRARLLREFIEEYQGSRDGNWMNCVVCRQHAVCYHEIMELEALAQPARLEAIMKALLIQFGGERYEGKIICKNCGQGIQDIDYDDHVEFDDEGRPIVTHSVLTEEQMNEGPAETSWAKQTAALMGAAIRFDDPGLTAIAETLTEFLQRAGFQAPADTFRAIVINTNTYVAKNVPERVTYERTRTAALLKSSGKLSVPTYEERTAQLRVIGLAAFTVLALQSAEQPITVTSTVPICRFSRGGWPIDPDRKTASTGAVNYVACVLASIDRDVDPWRSVGWKGEPKFESKKTMAFKELAMALIEIVKDPGVQSALERARTDVATIRKQKMVSIEDQLPVGFRPEPFPIAIGRPALETDPVPPLANALAAGRSVMDQADPIMGALRQEAAAVISELHTAATVSTRDSIASIANTTDSVCCPVSIAEADAGKLLGAPTQKRLVQAASLVRDGDPASTKAGTHLWSEFATPITTPVAQVIEEGVLFKLFLKYCYTGPQIGEPHEFSTGNFCRQCGLSLGKPLDLVDFGTEGAAILAGQQGGLRVEVTSAAFDALSDAVRRRRILAEPRAEAQAPWRYGLELLIATAQARGDLGVDEGHKVVAARLQAVLDSIVGHEDEPVDEVARSLRWTPIAEYMDFLRSQVAEKIGPLTGRTPRAREANAALGVFDAITEEPFVEGPRVLQEYWCGKAEAAGHDFAVVEVRGAKWFKISEQHNQRINQILRENSTWYAGEVSENMRKILRRVGGALGPVLRAWIRAVRPSAGSGFWTVDEARILMRTFVLQTWYDALSGSSWMYRDMAVPAEIDAAVAGLSNWTRALMLHVKQQFIRFSRERVRQELEKRAALERNMIVEEFTNTRDDDVKSAMLIQKQLRIGRWAGVNLRSNDPDTYDFFVEQAHRMGVMEQPVEPTLLESQGGGAAAEGGWGFGDAAAPPEAGYDVDQGAEGDDY